MAPPAMEISSALLSIPEKRESLRKVFGDLEEHRDLIAVCSGGWKELDASLSAIHDALEKRYAEILEKETKFEEKIKERQDALDKRESVIESREQASLARVQEQKDAAIAAIREQKRKWIEEKQLLQSQSVAKPVSESASPKAKHKDTKGQKYESGIAKAGQPANVNTAGKEKEGSLNENHDMGAEKAPEGITFCTTSQKDGALSELQKVKHNPSDTSVKNEESLKLHNSVSSVEAFSCKPLKEKVESKMATEVGKERLQNNAPQIQMKEAQSEAGSAEVNAQELEDQPKAMDAGDDDGIKAMDEDASDDDEKEESNKKLESSQSSVRVRPELISLCEKMDGPGLFKYLIAQKKLSKDIQKELPIAMKSASDPSHLVLLAIKEYQLSESGTEGAQFKKLASRRSCIAFLESLASVFNAEGRTGNGVSDDVKEEAKAIAESWKLRLNPKETERAALLDVQSFLQLVATFGLASEFSENELCELVFCICFRKQTPKLWRALGLAHKTSDLVDSLIKDAKHLDAISFVQEYQLTEKFPPVNLLKGYLKEIRKGHTSSMSADDKDELHMKELNAARTVLKCVEKYKLQGDYPVEGLERRIAQLEKLSSGDKKRVADTDTGGLKKARTVNGPAGPFRSSDRFGGRGNVGRSYGSPFSRGVGRYPYPAGGRGFPSSYTHGNYQYGGGPPYQGPYSR